MKKILLIILSVSSLNLLGNFGGYYRHSNKGGGTILNSSNSQMIELVKEKIDIILDQRVNFNAEFTLRNTSQEIQKITVAFPQFSYWDIPYQNGKGYLPGNYYPLNEKIIINETPINFDNELFSVELNSFDSIKLANKSDFKQTLIEYAKFNEAENPPSMPIIIWKIKTISFNPNETKVINISFTRPWFYQDALWSTGTRTKGERSFNYIFETANTWKDSKIGEFSLSIKFPEEAWDNLNLNNSFFERTSQNEVNVNLTNWTPSNKENLNIIWETDYKLIAMDTKDCVESIYYDDYCWQFGFDATKMTSWCLKPSNLNCETLYLRDKSSNENKKTEDDLKLQGSTLKLINGFAKNEKLAEQNAKPKKIQLTYYDSLENKITQIFNIANTSSIQSYKLTHIVDLRKDIILNIIDYYPGTKYQDICIAELWIE